MGRAVRLETRVQPYPWGSRTAIAELAGRAPSGDPEAELWVGAHPRGASVVLLEEESVPLGTWIGAAPTRRLGRDVHARFYGLPFLLKYLAAAEPLSIQCHPNAEQARLGFLREEEAGVPRNAATRTYRDSNPKPELIVSRGHFEALDGFRDPAEIIDLLGPLGAIWPDDLFSLFRAHPGRDGLEDFYRHLMRMPSAAQADLTKRVIDAARPSADRNPAFDWVLRLGEAYPGDVGVLSPLLLNYVSLERDEALFLDAGELHAYLGGEGVELMANSDNVVRGGLTGKHVDVPELLDLLTYRTGPRAPLKPRTARPGVLTYDAPAEHFALSLLRPEAGQVLEMQGRRPAAMLGLQGELTVTTEGPALVLRPGEALFVPADAPPAQIAGPGEAVWATVP